ncbi:MAG: OadG family protein [Caldisericaceae bacterium]
MNSSIINEGLYIGVVGMTITFAVLALLGFILYLFKVLIYKNGKGIAEQIPEAAEDVEYAPEKTKGELSDKKKIAAIVAAVATFFSSQKRAEEDEYKHTAENNADKSLKNKRWRNG